MRGSARLLAWLLVAATCGAADTRVRDASNAEYRIPRDVLWAEIIDVLRARSPGVQIAALDANRLATQWMEAGWSVASTGPAVSRGRPVLTPLLQRVIVTISGANPYRVAVDVEGGTWESIPAPVPMAHSVDEPKPIGRGRETLTLEIHERLKVREHAP